MESVAPSEGCARWNVLNICMAIPVSYNRIGLPAMVPPQMLHNQPISLYKTDAELDKDASDLLASPH